MGRLAGAQEVKLLPLVPLCMVGHPTLRLAAGMVGVVAVVLVHFLLVRKLAFTACHMERQQEVLGARGLLVLAAAAAAARGMGRLRLPLTGQRAAAERQAAAGRRQGAGVVSV